MGETIQKKKTKNIIYTQDFVLNEMKSLLQALNKDKGIVYIWELFEQKKYSRQRYSERVKKYSEVEEIAEISDTIKEILETRAVVWAMKNKLNPTTVIFHMKNNYDRKDKSEQKIDMDMTAKVVNLPPMQA